MIDLGVDSETPMLQPPRRTGVPTADGHFTPHEFLALTQDAFGHELELEDTFGLTEDPLKHVGKDGIQVLKEFYSNPLLAEHTTGPAGSLRKDLVIRYDRALAARGVLNEVVVLEKDDAGRYVELCRCVPREEVQQIWSKSDLLKQRDHYMRTLLAKRSEYQHAFRRITRGLEHADALMDAFIARQKRQKRAKTDPVVVTPIYAEQLDSDETERPLAAKLRQRRQQNLDAGHDAKPVTRKKQSKRAPSPDAAKSHSPALSLADMLAAGKKRKKE